MAKKILFLCKERIDTYGKSVGLMVSAEFIKNYLDTVGVESEVIKVVDGNSIDREVFNYKPDIVILEAIWVTPDKIRELLAIPRYKDIEWIIRIHSKIPFLANEGIAISWLAQFKQIQDSNEHLHISANNDSVCDDLYSALGLKELYLPNIYFPNDDVTTGRGIKDPKILDVGCFGALRLLKNQLIQAIAAIEYGNEYGFQIKFHINCDRQEQHGDNVYKNIKALFAAQTKHSLVEHNWMKHSDFIKVVRTMDIGLQVSMSESFNIVAADFVWNNVPIIGAKDIDWMPYIFKADPNSSTDIKNKMKLILSTRDPRIYKLNNLALDWYNHRAKNTWDFFLESY